MTAEERMVIFASSLGTVFEWYDFYIYGTLAPILAAQFFAGVNPSAAFIFTLLAFAAGFAVRPFGALFFGRLGDLIGRKYTFLITMTLMGLGTFSIGLLPNYAGLGHCGADHAHLPAPVPGACARRRIRRRGDLRRRACPEEQARLLHVVDPDHGDARPVHGAAHRARHPHLDGRDRVRRPRQLDRRLAHSIPALGDPARGIDLDPAEAQRIAGVPADEGRGPRLEAPADRGVRPMGQPEDRNPRAVRRYRRRGGGLVRRAVLRAVLPDPDAQGAGGDGADPDRGRAC